MEKWDLVGNKLSIYKKNYLLLLFLDFYGTAKYVLIILILCISFK